MRQGARVLGTLLLLLVTSAAPALAAPEGTMTWAMHVTLAARWLDPADTEAAITPFMVFYAIHDALVKPMPAGLKTPSLAESWTASPDGLTYEFTLRGGVKFHNGEPITAEDVKFSFDRYKGAAFKLMKEKVKEVQVVDPRRIRFHLHRPWPDFMTFYGTSATGAGWIVPRKYVERVGDDGFKKAPIGAGPYRVVSFTPGVELVLEAFEGYWRKVPSVKRLVFRSMPEETTRAAALKRGEVDIAYFLNGPVAEDVRRTPNLKLLATRTNAVFFLDFLDQWDRASPWHDRRVRLAANLAIDQRTINEATLLGFAGLTGNIVPSTFEFALPIDPFPYDPKRAKELLAEAGYPNGFDAGDLTPVPPYNAMAEAVVLGALGAAGNAGTRLQALVTKGGMYASGVLPEVEDLFQRQLSELDPKKREALLHQIQKIVHERVLYAPIWENAFIRGIGPRVEESGLNLIPAYPYSAPYEDVRLKRP